MNETWLQDLEKNWDEVREAVTRFSGEDTASRLSIALIGSNKDECRTLLFKAWDEAPDAPWIHEEPGFGIICDLLDEGFYDES